MHPSRSHRHQQGPEGAFDSDAMITKLEVEGELTSPLVDDVVAVLEQVRSLVEPNGVCASWSASSRRMRTSR